MKNTKLYRLLFEAAEDNNPVYTMEDMADIAWGVNGDMRGDRNAYIVLGKEPMKTIDDTGGKVIYFDYIVKMETEGWEGLVGFQVNLDNLVARSIKGGEPIKKSTKEFIPDGSKGKQENLEELKRFVIHEIKGLIQLGMLVPYMEEMEAEKAEKAKR
jgi:hypothetical protein